MDPRYWWWMGAGRRHRSRKRLQGIAGFVLAMTLYVPATFAANLAVIYPQIREPYRQVFVAIAEGVAGHAGVKVLTLETNDETTSADLETWLKRHHVDRLVALGNSGIDLVNALPENRPATVVGAAVINPAQSRFSGVTLNPAPEKLFQLAKTLRPALRTVHVVYEPDYNQWVIDAATEQAAALDLELRVYPVGNMREAAGAYRKVQDNLNAKTEALWLPMGGPSRDKAVLQNILQTAWSQDQMIFSSSLSDVRRGVLFALYPDNQAMGATLAAILEARSNTPDAPLETVFVSTLLQAINLRTADHLGMRFNRQELGNFDFVYPPP